MTLVETKYNVSDGAVHSIFVRSFRYQKCFIPNFKNYFLNRGRLLKVEERNTSNSYCIGSVKLNNSYSMNGEQRLSDPNRFDWPWRMHIGGRPSGVSTPPEILFLPGMVGCAYLLEVRDGQRLSFSRNRIGNFWVFFVDGWQAS